MKHSYTFRRILSALVLLMASTIAWAYDFEADGICYNILDEESVEVTSHLDDYPYNDESSNYKGGIVIPSAVTYEDKTYSVTNIGKDAFCGCRILTSVHIPDGVTSIGKDAFWFCTSITSINIPASVTNIGEGAFGGCFPLVAITVSEDNSVYDSREGCNAIIESATNTLIAGCMNTVIPASVTSIGNKAFMCCPGLTGIKIPESVTSIGEYAFYECTTLLDLEIPGSVTSIGLNTFSFCRSLRTVTILEGATSIEGLFFNECTALLALDIPSSVTNIEGLGFQNCPYLPAISCHAEKVPRLSSPGDPRLTLYVPESALDAYKAADNWKDFGEIRPISTPEATGQ